MSTDPRVQETLEELYDLRRSARELMRSGHPGVAAEGRSALNKIDLEIESLRLLDAQL